jgi:hypothetical protein
MSHFFIILFKYISLSTGIAAIARLRIKPFRFWSVVAATLAILLIHLYAMFRLEYFGYDFSIFWKAGRDVWAGLDPYAADRFADHPFLQPPTALPLFGLFAVPPFGVSLALWTVANVLASLALVVLAQCALGAQARLAGPADGGGPGRWRLPASATAGLSICLTFSDSSLMGFYLGQLSVFAAVMLLGALLAQGKGRPVWAGVCLSLATVKIGTMLPFLLLFLRKGDRWTWISLSVLVLGFCSLTGRMTELPGRLAAVLDHIGELSAPGKVNDYSFEGPRSEGIIGFEPLFYRLGMRDRASIRNAQFVALLTLGGWVGYLVVSGALSRPAACALVALYSVLFLYHRDYDTVILALPMVYGACRARAAPDDAHRPYVAIGLLAMAILYLNAVFLRPLTQSTLAWGGWGRLVQIIVLPYATWLALLAMILLVWTRGPVTAGVDRADRLTSIDRKFRAHRVG